MREMTIVMELEKIIVMIMEMLIQILRREHHQNQEIHANAKKEVRCLGYFLNRLYFY